MVALKGEFSSYTFPGLFVQRHTKAFQRNLWLLLPSKKSLLREKKF